MLCGRIWRGVANTGRVKKEHDLAGWSGHNRKHARCKALNSNGDLVSSKEAGHKGGMVLVYHEPPLGCEVLLLQRLEQVSRHLRHLFLVSAFRVARTQEVGGKEGMGEGGCAR